jgi:hypothetical protein
MWCERWSGYRGRQRRDVDVLNLARRAQDPVDCCTRREISARCADPEFDCA